MLTDALTRTYGHGVAAAVTHELGLTPHRGEPLSSCEIALAMDMAQTCSDALLGVDFMTRVHCSAVVGGPGFKAACESLGLSPAAFDAAERLCIDIAMRQRFDEAALQKQSPVSPDIAQQWLHSVLRS
jgi:hypothetical protein